MRVQSDRLKTIRYRIKFTDPSGFDWYQKLSTGEYIYNDGPLDDFQKKELGPLKDLGIAGTYFPGFNSEKIWFTNTGQIDFYSNSDRTTRLDEMNNYIPGSSLTGQKGGAEYSFSSVDDKATFWYTTMPYVKKSKINRNGGGRNKNKDEKLHLISKETENVANLETTLVGGSASIANAEAVAVEDLSAIAKGLGVASRTIGTIGVIPSAYNLGAKIDNGDATAADYTDGIITGTLFALGCVCTAPLSASIIVGVGLTYGITRIVGGDEIDNSINSAWKNFNK